MSKPTGQVAYETFRTFFSTNPHFVDWEKLPDSVKAAWQATADSVKPVAPKEEQK